MTTAYLRESPCTPVAASRFGPRMTGARAALGVRPVREGGAGAGIPAGIHGKERGGGAALAACALAPMRAPESPVRGAP